jgi:DNA-binding CsgD family transcriptional regulator
MKLEIFNAEAKNIWKTAVSRSSHEQLTFELDLYKKLLNFFQVGDYYYFIFHIAIFEFELVSREIETVLGYQPSEFDLKHLLDITHPEDRPYFLNFESKAGEFLANLPVEKLMKYKIRYDYRIKKNNGQYIRILQQAMVIDHDEAGRIVRTFATHTDITHLKAEGKPVFSIIGLEGEPSYINIDVEKIFAVTDETLTKREKEILNLLIEGNHSKQIGEILNISKQTVDKHRKNMLYKHKLNSTGELIGKAIRQGWL